LSVAPRNKLLVRRWRFIGAAVLLAVGAWLRFYHLDQYPLGVHQDELSNIYDGYSLAETGADRFGDRHPAIVRAFGENDYRPAMYAWLVAIPIRIAGFSIAAGRVPAAVLGLASLVLLGLFARNIGGKDFALLVLLLGVLSPIHIQYSRVAHEAAILPAFFAIATLYLWERSARRSFSLPLTLVTGLVIGLSASAYQATRLTAFLFAVAVAIDIVRSARPRVIKLAALAIGALIGALPQIFVLLTDSTHFFARARVLVTPVENPIAYVAQVVWNFWLNLAPVYLFYPGHGIALTVARLLPPEIVFFYLGLFTLALLRGPPESRGRYYVYAAMFIVILPCALTGANPDPIRASGVVILTPLFSAAGIVFLYWLLSGHQLLRKLYYPAVACVMISASAFLVIHYSRSMRWREEWFQHFLVLLDSAVGKHESAFDAVIVERYGTQRYIYTAAFTGMTPREFQRAPKVLYSHGMDQFQRLGKYYFVSPRFMAQVAENVAAQPGRVLFVSSEPMAGLRIIDSVAFQQERGYLLTR
jgi:4-amino-4-deoxy-L-arabinose transferase-like glycosyltransferase